MTHQHSQGTDPGRSSGVSCDDKLSFRGVNFAPDVAHGCDRSTIRSSTRASRTSKALSKFTVNHLPSQRYGTVSSAAPGTMSQGIQLRPHTDVSMAKLRVVEMGKLLAFGCGIHKVSPVGDLSGQDLYHSSMPLGEHSTLTYFLSHTWRSNYLLKYATMLYFINGRHALKAGHLGAVLAFAAALCIQLDWGYRFPTVRLPATNALGFKESLPEFADGGYSLTYVCLAMGGLSQTLVLLFGHRIFPMLSRATAFFDKVCICQTDKELKRQGLECFGGILCRSESMVIFWDDDYFDRLWCTYEVAAFCHFRGFGALQFKPLAQATFAIGMMATVILGCLSFFPLLLILEAHDLLPRETVGFFFGFWVLTGGCCFWLPKFVLCYSLALGRRKLKAQLGGFKVRDAKCYSEADRSAVNTSIEEWFGSLDNFDQVVREQLPKRVSEFMGRDKVAIRYEDMLFENAGGLWWVMYDGLLGLSPDTQGLAAAFRLVVFGVGLHFVFNPLFLVSASALARLIVGPLSGSRLRYLVAGVAVNIAGLWLPIWLSLAVHAPLSLSCAILAVAAGFAIWIFHTPDQSKASEDSYFDDDDEDGVVDALPQICCSSGLADMWTALPMTPSQPSYDSPLELGSLILAPIRERQLERQLQHADYSVHLGDDHSPEVPPDCRLTAFPLPQMKENPDLVAGLTGI